MKVAIILEQYLTEYAEKSIVSVERTRSSVAALTRELGRYDHTRLTPRLLRAYRAPEKLEPATINRDFGVLRAALRYAEEQRRIRNAPVIEERGGANKRVTWLRPEEVTALLEAAVIYPILLAFIKLSLLTGQRKEAVLSLRWTQVDRLKNVVWFNDHDLPMADRRKGRGSVAISAGLGTLLDELANSTPFVLISSRGSRLQDINWDHWYEVTKAAGLDGLRPHDLRHTVATNLIREEVPLIDVSKLLGHANSRITEEIYVNHQPHFLKRAVAHLDKLMGVA